MNKSKSFYSILCFLLYIPIIANAGVKLPKFGKAKANVISTEICPTDSGAHAYYIFNIGNDEFVYNEQDGFKLNINRHFMIKIIDETAFDWADIEIPLYQGDTDDRVYGIKAITYNMVDGKVEESKLDKDNIFWDQHNEYWTYAKFTLPDVKAGSVIEVSYTVSSIYFFNLQEWEVQTTIPVLESYYKVAIPEYFIYNQTQRGYIRIHTEREYSNNEISFRDGSKVFYTENCFTYHNKNIPAFKIEGFLRTPLNYLSAVEFELSRIEYPQQPVERFNTTWDVVTEKLLEHAEIGYRIRSSGFTKDLAKQLSTKKLSKEQLLQKAFSYIQKHYASNGSRSIYTTGSLRKTYEAGVGNCADINYALIVLLEELGFESFPVMLSTTNRRMLMPINPSISSLNYAIAGVEIDGQIHLMDASDKFSQIDLLPYHCLNYKGRRIQEGKSNWVDLSPQKLFYRQKVYSLKLNEDGTLSGNIKITDSGYGAYDLKKEIIKDGSEKSYVEDLQKQLKGLEINDYSIDNSNTADDKIISNFEVTISGGLQSAGDLILLNPMLYDAVTENPFKMESREYPIEFKVPTLEAVMVQIELPDGFVLDEKPESLKIGTEDRSCIFVYEVISQGNKVVLNSIHKRTRVQYLPNEYNQIKQFYNALTAKEQSNIIIKKANDISTIE